MCPLCSRELDINVKRKLAVCDSCGWIKRTDSTETKAGKVTHLEDYILRENCFSRDVVSQVVREVLAKDQI